MRRSLLPSIHALAAFECVARHGSVVRASEELNLSQSAVSRLVRQVEDTLQLTFFRRVRQRLVLTEAGKAYAANLRTFFKGLEQATLQTMAYGSGPDTRVLNLGVFATLGTKWLLPRLPSFILEYPNAIINCYARPRPFSFEDDPLDAAFHYGPPIWPGATLEKVFDEKLIPVAAPQFFKDDVPKVPEDLLQYPLLHEATRPYAWQNWFSEQGVTASALVGARFDQFGMVAQAAAVGLGIALIPSFLVEEELQSGILKPVLPAAMAGDFSYFLAFPERNASNPVLQSFRSWLTRTASAIE